MKHNHEYETYERKGIEPPRSYYIPCLLACKCTVTTEFNT